MSKRTNGIEFDGTKPLKVTWKKQRRKVARVRIINLEGCASYYFVTYINEVYCVKTYQSRKSAIRGARRFCKTIGFECEIQKEGK